MSKLLVAQSANKLLDSFDSTDVLSSGTLQIFRSDRKLFSNFLSALDGSMPDTRRAMLDMGCGFGALSTLLGNSLGLDEIYGIDGDNERAEAAVKRGLQLSRLDLEKDPFPYPSETFDLATTFGVLDHLKTIDNPIGEAHRVLKPGGCLAVSNTNLGSWVTRFSLLLGYQPRNIEISRKGLFGVHRLYKELYTCTDAMGRITSFTLRALEEYLKQTGFEILKRWGTGLIPAPDRDPGSIVKTVDRVLSRRPSWAIRYIVLSRKVG